MCMVNAARTLLVMLLSAYETEYLYVAVIIIYKGKVSKRLGCKGSYDIYR